MAAMSSGSDGRGEEVLRPVPDRANGRVRIVFQAAGDHRQGNPLPGQAGGNVAGLVEVSPALRLDDLGHGDARPVVVHHHHLAARDQAVVRMNVDHLAELAVQRDHGAATELQQRADPHGGLAQHRADRDRYVVHRFQILCGARRSGLMGNRRVRKLRQVDLDRHWRSPNACRFSSRIRAARTSTHCAFVFLIMKPSCQRTATSPGDVVLRLCLPAAGWQPAPMRPYRQARLVLGQTQAQLASQSDMLGSVSDALATRLGAVRNSDAATLSSEVNATQNQLTASYTLIADMKGMSLAACLELKVVSLTGC